MLSAIYTFLLLFTLIPVPIQTSQPNKSPSSSYSTKEATSEITEPRNAEPNDNKKEKEETKSSDKKKKNTDTEQPKSNAILEAEKKITAIRNE